MCVCVCGVRVGGWAGGQKVVAMVISKRKHAHKVVAMVTFKRKHAHEVVAMVTFRRKHAHEGKGGGLREGT